MDFRERFKGRTNFMPRQGIIDQGASPPKAGIGQTPQKPRLEHPLISNANTSSGTQVHFNVSRPSAAVSESQFFQGGLRSSQPTNGFHIPIILVSGGIPQYSHQPSIHSSIEKLNSALNHQQIEKGRVLSFGNSNMGTQQPYIDFERKSSGGGVHQQWGQQSYINTQRNYEQRDGYINRKISQDQTPPRQPRQKSHKFIQKLVSEQMKKAEFQVLPELTPRPEGDLRRQLSLVQISQDHQQTPDFPNIKLNEKSVITIKDESSQMSRNSQSEQRLGKLTQDKRRNFENPQEPLDDVKMVQIRQDAVSNLREQLSKRIKENDLLRNGSYIRIRKTEAFSTREIEPDVLNRDAVGSRNLRNAQGMSRQQNLTFQRNVGKLQARSYNNVTGATNTSAKKSEKGDYGQDVKDSSQGGKEVNNSYEEQKSLIRQNESFSERKQTIKHLRTGQILDQKHSEVELPALKKELSGIKLVPCPVAESENGPDERSPLRSLNKKRKIRNLNYHQQTKLRQIIQQNTTNALPKHDDDSQAQYSDLIETSRKEIDRLQREQSNKELLLFSPLVRSSIIIHSFLIVIQFSNKEVVVDVTFNQQMLQSDQNTISEHSQYLPHQAPNFAVRKSYHDAFSMQKQQDILQEILKLQVNQVERPKSPPSVSGRVRQAQTAQQ